jgi:deoxycytidylate deaminase
MKQYSESKFNNYLISYSKKEKYLYDICILYAMIRSKIPQDINGHAYIGAYIITNSCNIYSTGYNKYDIDLGRRIRNIPKTVHAEIDACMKIRKSLKNKKEKVSLVVYRTNKRGDCLLMAKPCFNCITNSKQILEYKGYKLCNIFYTNEEGNLTSL